MKELVFTSKFKKDYRKYVNKPKFLQALNDILRMLEKGERLPADRKPHRLHGIYEGCTECHIGGDFLLIWIDEATNTIKLVRLGTHHELFGL